MASLVAAATVVDHSTQHGAVCASYHWLDDVGCVVIWDGLRTPLGRPDQTTCTRELSVQIAPPPGPGLYELQFALVEEGVGWSEPISISVEVKAGKVGSISRHASVGHAVSSGGTERPLALVCETISACNYQCLFCASPHQQRKAGVMPMDRFRLLLDQYADLGGGELSFTSVGEPLLDGLLVRRIAEARDRSAIGGLSMTTNASLAADLSKDRLEPVMDALEVVQVSVYGLDREEHLAITGTDDFDRMLNGLRRIVAMRSKLVRIAIRSGKSMTEGQARDQILRWLGAVELRCELEISGPLRQFANWGLFRGTEALFEGASWLANQSPKSQCLHPLFALKVFWNGDASACSCGDYDAHPDLSLGNIHKVSLRQMCQSTAFRRFWNWQRHGIPEHCQRCSFYTGLENAARIPGALSKATSVLA